MRHNVNFVIIFLLLLLGCGQWGRLIGEARPAVATDDSLTRAARAVARLQAWYDPASGLYQTTGWWNSANAITTLVDYSRVSGIREYDSTLLNTFAAAQKQNPNFLNKFYDDEGWWALAWVDAYDLTGNEQFLSMSKTIFADMAGGWDSVRKQFIRSSHTSAIWRRCSKQSWKSATAAR